MRRGQAKWVLTLGLGLGLGGGGVRERRRSLLLLFLFLLRLRERDRDRLCRRLVPLLSLRDLRRDCVLLCRLVLDLDLDLDRLLLPLTRRFFLYMV